MPEYAGKAAEPHRCGSRHSAKNRSGGMVVKPTMTLPHGGDCCESCSMSTFSQPVRKIGGSTNTKSLISFSRSVALLRKVVGLASEITFQSHRFSDYNRFAECAVPLAVRLTYPVGRRFSSLWRKQCARLSFLWEAPFVWGGREKSVRETLVSLEVGDWQRIKSMPSLALN